MFEFVECRRPTTYVKYGFCLKPSLLDLLQTQILFFEVQRNDLFEKWLVTLCFLLVALHVAILLRRVVSSVQFSFGSFHSFSNFKTRENLPFFFFRKHLELFHQRFHFFKRKLRFEMWKLNIQFFLDLLELREVRRGRKRMLVNNWSNNGLYFFYSCKDPPTDICLDEELLLVQFFEI